MKYFDQYSSDNFDVNHLLPREPFYVRLIDEASLVRYYDKIKDLTSKTTDVFISLPSELFELDSVANLLMTLDLKGLIPQFKYHPTKWNHVVGFGDFNSGDRDIINQFLGIKNRYGEKFLFGFEIKILSDMRILASTISGLYFSGAEIGVLDSPSELDPEMIKKLTDVFRYLKIRNVKKINIYFPFWFTSSLKYNLKTLNTFSGIEQVHIDLSNKCTHSCVFCGLYGPDFIEDHKKRSGGVISDFAKKMMSQEANAEKVREIIKALPWTVKSIQFGGLGDPLMHKSAVDLIVFARERGFYVEILSNMEYLAEEDLLRLNSVGGNHFHDLHFVANVSGGDSKTYIATRPRQNERVFEKIKYNLSKLASLRSEATGRGVFFTVMCVVNKYNYDKLEKLVDFSIEVGAGRLWFKPMEVHLNLHKDLLIKDAPQLESLSNSLRSAISRADSMGLKIFEREVCEKIIEDIGKST